MKRLKLKMKRLTLASKIKVLTFIAGVIFTIAYIMPIANACAASLYEEPIPEELL